MLNHVWPHVSWLHHHVLHRQREGTNKQTCGAAWAHTWDHRGEDSPDRSPDRIARLEEALVSQQELLLGTETDTLRSVNLHTNVQRTGKSPLMCKSTMAMFNSFVSLPEGIYARLQNDIVNSGNRWLTVIRRWVYGYPSVPSNMASREISCS